MKQKTEQLPSDSKEFNRWYRKNIMPHPFLDVMDVLKWSRESYNEGYASAQRDQHEKEQRICEKYGI